MVFPDLTDRGRSNLLDAGILVLYIITIVIVVDWYSPDNGALKVKWVMGFWLLYEPLAHSFWGCTLGQKVFGLRVKRKSNLNKNILLPVAFIRLFVKLFLGWLSFLTISFEPKKRAVHDFFTASVVVYSKKEWREKGNAHNPQISKRTPASDTLLET